MTYDLYAVLKPDTADIQAKFVPILTKDGFTIENFENWGKKHLAYAIDKQTEGVYCLMQISGSGNPSKLTERFKLDASIIRTLILKKSHSSEVTTAKPS